MKTIDLIPFLYAGDFPHTLVDEMVDNDVSTHYQNDVMYLDWDEEEEQPETKKWLIETYGEEVKKYDHFAVQST